MINKQFDILPNECVYVLTRDNAGIGTFLRDTDLLVCCEKSIRNHTSVRIKNGQFDDTVEVVYVSESANLAFCRHNFDVKGYALEEVEINQGLNSISKNKIQGKPIIINESLLGLKSYPIIQMEAESIITATDISTACNEYLSEGKKPILKCERCGFINTLDIKLQCCQQCAAEITFKTNRDNRPAIFLRIEAIIKNVGYDPAFARRGSGIWYLNNGNITIELSYYLRNGSILAEVNLGKLSKDTREAELVYLLNQNYHNKDLVLSLKNGNIYLSLTLYDHYLDDKSAEKALIKMLKLSNNYYDIIEKEFT